VRGRQGAPKCDDRDHDLHLGQAPPLRTFVPCRASPMSLAFLGGQRENLVSQAAKEQVKGDFMADRTDIAEIGPVLELTLGPGSLTCAGTLDALTRRHVLEAVEIVLFEEPPMVDIDVSGLRIGDNEGANALVVIQRMVRDAGVGLHWRGLESKHAIAIPV
jgi:hypothetical protein